ncbi:hypothetical protein Tco_0513259 [Tanacetum coccineum]
MLSDTPRNTAYGKAIELMLSKHARNHTPHVLDIGSVKNRLAINDGRTCYGNILLIKISRNSNSLRVLPSYAQTLTTVSEILDSELLGEGLIPTLQHAHENLVPKAIKPYLTKQLYGQLTYFLITHPNAVDFHKKLRLSLVIDKQRIERVCNLAGKVVKFHYLKMST